MEEMALLSSITCTCSENAAFWEILFFLCLFAIKRMEYLQQMWDVFRQDFSFAQPYSTVFFSKLGSICMGCKSTKCIHVYLTTALGHVYCQVAISYSCHNIPEFSPTCVFNTFSGSSHTKQNPLHIIFLKDCQVWNSQIIIISIGVCVGRCDVLDLFVTRGCEW